jgi:hypothetical protein
LINVRENYLGSCFSVDALKILTHPLNEMILEGPFDDLMEKIRGEDFMDVCARKVCCERLQEDINI